MYICAMVLPGTKMAAVPGTKMAALPGTKMAVLAVSGGGIAQYKNGGQGGTLASPFGGGSAVLTSSLCDAAGRVDHGGGERGAPAIGTGSGPRGAQRGPLGSGRGWAAAERRQEAAGGGGGHPAGQAQVGTGVEGSREEEVGRKAPVLGVAWAPEGLFGGS